MKDIRVKEGQCISGGCPFLPAWEPVADDRRVMKGGYFTIKYRKIV